MRDRATNAAGAPPSRPRPGFSLVELLVTLGIIALLMGILLPVVSRARTQARGVSCRAQMQQIGHAIQNYVNEHKDRYPSAPALPSVNPNGWPTLMDHLDGYLMGVEEVWRCPADETVWPQENTSYFYYNELSVRPLRKTFFWKVFGNASQVPVLWDAGDYHGGADRYNFLFADGHVENGFLPEIE